MSEARADIRAAQEWVLQYGLEGGDVAELLTGSSERLAEAGLPIWRTHLSFPTLDPAKRSENIVWLRGGGATRETLSHEEFEGAFQRSPFPDMLRTGRSLGRWRLDQPGAVEGYPVMEAMQRAGGRDLIVRLVSFGGRVGRDGSARGVLRGGDRGPRQHHPGHRACGLPHRAGRSDGNGPRRLYRP